MPKFSSADKAKSAEGAAARIVAADAVIDTVFADVIQQFLRDYHAGYRNLSAAVTVAPQIMPRTRSMIESRLTARLREHFEGSCMAVTAKFQGLNRILIRALYES